MAFFYDNKTIFCLIFKWIKNLFLRIFIFMGMNHRNKRYGFTWRMKSFYWTQIMNEWIASIKITKRFMLLTKIITRKSVVRLHFLTFLCWNYFKMFKSNWIELLLELLMFVFVLVSFVLVSDGESLIWNRNWNSANDLRRLFVACSTFKYLVVGPPWSWTTHSTST